MTRGIMTTARSGGEMTTTDPRSDAAPTDSTRRDRKPYETPRVLFREPLEVLATVCSPAPPAKGNPVACPIGPISS